MTVMIVGVSGKAGSGKDSFSDTLVNEYGFVRVAFADPIKQHCKEVHSWNGMKDDYGRALLQQEGDHHRQFDSDVWLNIAKQRIKLLIEDENERIVITDMRCKRELDFIKHIKNEKWLNSYDVVGKTVRVEGREGNLSSETKNHSTETELDGAKFDKLVVNDSDLESLYEKCYEFYNSIIGVN